jgi:hypothetical protein
LSTWAIHTASLAPESHLCAHKMGCITIAGSFRTIIAGGDSYLLAEKVAEDWEGGFISIDEADKNAKDLMERALEALESAASDCGRDLVVSELQLQERDTLDYPNCVKVEKKTCHEIQSRMMRARTRKWRRTETFGDDCC